ncbi:MaoC family dehydratase [Pseudooceanicola sp.]|uniref:MaoC family dehydratase n=1 Tax=Pseudooceanicola sp. TaxID=1914328 RepID=UPI002620F118|nr:MaoC family dehydratase [Pseudooceanicola sp.]MDF1857050.1 MaoC family dehydratase [Pseudooceanicola sp.]
MTDYTRYDDLKIGDVLPPEPYRFMVNADVAQAYRAISTASLQGQGGENADQVPPMLAAVYIRGAQNALKGPPGGIHAKQRFTFRQPVRIGDNLSTTLEIVDKYEKKGRRYLVCATRTVNQEGDEVTLGQIVSIWGKET